MTTPRPMSPDERMAELESRMMVLEQLQQQRTEIIAAAVMATLQEEGTIAEYVRVIAAKVEAEWSGQFLPDLRNQLLRRLEEVESIVLPGGTEQTGGS